jgi:hypothetical protein
MTRPARRSREGDLIIASDASYAQSPRPERPDLSGAWSLESRPRAAAETPPRAAADVADGYLAVHNLGKTYGAAKRSVCLAPTAPARPPSFI